MIPGHIEITDLIDGLRAVSHDLRWSNPASAERIDALIARFEDTK